MPDERERQIAENESHFRDINDDLARRLRELPGDGRTVEFVCECGQLGCRAAIELTMEEYDRVRRESRDFIIVPGHEVPDVESVIERNDRFAVVRKHEETVKLVRERDPRWQQDR